MENTEAESVDDMTEADVYKRQELRVDEGCRSEFYRWFEE